MFHVGQKIICINDAYRPGEQDTHQGRQLPRRGVVYTVREVVRCAAFGYDDGEDGVRLVELKNPISSYRAPGGPCETELFFRMSRFAPLRRTGRTNITVFLRMLKRPAKKISASERRLLKKAEAKALRALVVLRDLRGDTVH